MLSIRNLRTEAAMSHVERATLGAIQVAVAALSSAEVFDNLEPVLAALMVAMDADLGGYYIHDTLGVSWPVLILPPDASRALPEPLRLPQPTSAGARMHPGWEHCLRQRAAPFAVTDVISDRAWQSSEVASLMRPYWGRQYQFAIPIYTHTDPARVPTKVSAWVFARSGHDFDARHHEVARLVRPVLAQVTRHHTAALREGGAPPGTGPGATPTLTHRERVILRLLAHDQTAEQIGRWLNISPRTVHKHVEHIYRKLNVHDRRDAVQRAVTLGVLETAGSAQRRAYTSPLH
jgi:DNA-binding NarL/FixJ family response regulator